MISAVNHTLVNPQNGNLAFKLFSFTDNGHCDHIQRLNYYSLIWIQKGEATLNADFASWAIGDNVLLAFSPYQPFMISTEEPISGITLHFHPDFFCIHKHQHEVACNGILFNNIYKPPFVMLDEATINTFNQIIPQIKMEMQTRELAQYESLVSYLKLILIYASRLKLQQQPETIFDKEATREPFILQNLMNSIESNYRVKRSPGEYSAMLNISPKALARIAKTHFNKTITSLIAERIIIEAKRELYLTNKSVKEIAYELGYEDEHYFSRFFKKNAEVSPQLYRETVGFGRGN